MATQTVIDGRAQIYTNFGQEQNFPVDQFHNILIRTLKDDPRSWVDLKATHEDLGGTTIRLNHRLSWDPRDVHLAPSKDRLTKQSGNPDLRLLTLGRILLDGKPTSSFWVLKECEDNRVMFGIPRRGGIIKTFTRYMAQLERLWTESCHGGICDWSAKAQLYEIDEITLAELEKEACPEEMQSMTGQTTPITPPETPEKETSPEDSPPITPLTPTTPLSAIIEHLSPQVLATLTPEERQEMRLAAVEEKKLVMADLDLHQSTTYKPKTNMANMALGERFLARHLGPNMLAYLNTIPNDTPEHCEIADRALDEEIVKKFRNL